jgi:hypothetical protein
MEWQKTRFPGREAKTLDRVGRGSEDMNCEQAAA